MKLSWKSRKLNETRTLQNVLYGLAQINEKLFACKRKIKIQFIQTRKALWWNLHFPCGFNTSGCWEGGNSLAHMPSSWVGWWRGVAQHRVNPSNVVGDSGCYFHVLDEEGAESPTDIFWVTQLVSHRPHLFLSFSACDLASWVDHLQNLSRELTTVQVFMNLGLSRPVVETVPFALEKNM